MQVRPFEDRDFSRQVEIGNLVTPDLPRTEAEARHFAASFDEARYHRSRVVAEDDGGRVIGWGILQHMEDQYHPDKYYLGVEVDPANQRQGVGSALFDTLCEEATQRGAIALRATAREHPPANVRFMERREFRELRRSWESRLDVAAFDPTPFAAARRRLEDGGLAVTTLAEQTAADSEALRAAYDLFLVCLRDVPAVDPVTDIAFDQFVAMEVEAPDARHDLYFFAKDGDHLVGQSVLYQSGADPGLMYQGLTAVRSEYRGRGIATALKLIAIEQARARGAREIATDNDTANVPMLRINDKLGFVRQPPWIVAQRDLV